MVTRAHLGVVWFIRVCVSSLRRANGFARVHLGGPMSRRKVRVVSLWRSKWMSGSFGLTLAGLSAAAFVLG